MLYNEILRFLSEIEIDITAGGHKWRYDLLCSLLVKKGFFYEFSATN